MSSRSVATYRPDAVQVLINGLPVTGFADGTFVEIDRAADAFVKHVGADGKTSRAGTADKSGMVTFTLAQTSPSNGVLSGIAALDEATGNGVVSILVRDASGASLHFAESAWVRKIPAAPYSKAIENRVWILDCAFLESLNAGNASQSGGNA